MFSEILEIDFNQKRDAGLSLTALPFVTRAFNDSGRNVLLPLRVSQFDVVEVAGVRTIIQSSVALRDLK